MAFRIARRAGVAAASMTVAAAGLLAMGSPASAAVHSTDARTAIVSHHAQLLDTPDNVRSRDAGQGSDDDYRRRWVSDQIEWIQDHERVGHWMSDDEGRRHWVNDQIEWARNHN
ncbi:hypothetical protein [Streptomyces fagopyri]|uniref:hypothetical protein n=1 Tax=Streptomyces fagopyri TaxID=2662397 RepID=UPI0037224671